MQHFIPIKVHSVFPLLRSASFLGSYQALTRESAHSECSVLYASAQYVSTIVLVELSVPNRRKHYFVLS